jgi:ATP-dependent Clp protease protease subunit
MEEKDKSDQDDWNNKFMQSRSVLLFGGVDSTQGQKIIKQLLILDEENDQPIKVYIDSPGGSIDAGFAIYDTIRYLNSPVYTITAGLAASMGAMILLAAPKERRLGFTNSRYLIHQPLISGHFKGVATDIEIQSNEMNKYRNKINALIALETLKPLEQIAKDTDRDFWLNATEAVEYGLISSIISKKNEVMC